MARLKFPCLMLIFAISFFISTTKAAQATGFKFDVGLGLAIPTMSGDVVEDPVAVSLYSPSLGWGVAFNYEDSPLAAFDFMLDAGYSPWDRITFLLLFDLALGDSDSRITAGILQADVDTRWLSWGLYLNTEYVFNVNGQLKPYVFGGPGIRKMSLLDSDGDGLIFDEAFSMDAGVGIYYKIIGFRLTYNWVNYSHASFEVEGFDEASGGIDTNGGYISLLFTVGRSRGD